MMKSRHTSKLLGIEYLADDHESSSSEGESSLNFR